MRYAIIVDGVVVNAAVANQALESNWVQSDEAKIGDLYQDGQFITPAIPIQIPESISMRQCRLQLLAENMLDDVNAAIAAIPDEMQRKTAEIEWEYATTVERSSPWVEQLGSALGLSDSQLDKLFIDAAIL